MRPICLQSGERAQRVVAEVVESRSALFPTMASNHYIPPSRLNHSWNPAGSYLFQKFAVGERSKLLAVFPYQDGHKVSSEVFLSKIFLLPGNQSNHFKMLFFKSEVKRVLTALTTSVALYLNRRLHSELFGIVSLTNRRRRPGTSYGLCDTGILAFLAINGWTPETHHTPSFSSAGGHFWPDILV